LGEKTLSLNQTEEKIRTTITDWETLRSNMNFGGMTLKQFKAKVLPSLTARTILAALPAQVRRQRSSARPRRPSRCGRRAEDGQGLGRRP
jgi:hypothetical protein